MLRSPSLRLQYVCTMYMLKAETHTYLVDFAVQECDVYVLCISIAKAVSENNRKIVAHHQKISLT